MSESTYWLDPEEEQKKLAHDDALAKGRELVQLLEKMQRQAARIVEQASRIQAQIADLLLNAQHYMEIRK